MECFFPNLERENSLKGRGMEGMQSLFILWDRTLACSQSQKRTHKDTWTKTNKQNKTILTVNYQAKHKM